MNNHKMDSNYLLLNVVGASNLRSTDENGFSDPYAIILIRKIDGTLSRKNWSTCTIDKTLNPHWDKRIKILLKPCYKDIIIEIWDKDLLKDDWLGDVVISDIQSVKQFRGDIPLGAKWDHKDSKFNILPKGRVNVNWEITANVSKTFLRRSPPNYPKREVTRTYPKKNDHIAIIGAGPAGLHMAHLLVKDGYKNITIIEKTDRVGGKAITERSGDIPHELGACFLHPLYFEFASLIAEYHPPLTLEMAPGCDKCSDRNIYTSVSAKSQGREKYVFSSAEKLVLPENFWFLPDLLQSGTVYKHFLRYKNIHAKIFGTYDYTFPPLPNPKQKQLMNMTMEEFLYKYGCDALIPLFNLGHVAQGYGFLQKIPALYGLWWFTPALFSTYLPAPLGKNPRGTELLTMLRDGFGYVFQRIYEIDKLNVIFNVDIASIVREDRNVIIEGKKDSIPFVQKFDYLIITSPLKESLSFLKPPLPEEIELFTPLRPSQLVVTLYESDQQSRNDQVIQYFLFNLKPNNPGALYGQRNSARCVHVLHGKVCPHTNRETYVAYQYLEPNEIHMTDRDVLNKFYNSLREMGVTNIKILYQKRFDYFYQYDLEHIMMEYPWKILDIQGINRTMYAGASACYESVHDVINYNLMLFNQLIVPNQ